MNKLYVKLATTNMKNNKQFYLPYLLMGILSVAMFYLMMAMQDNPGLDTLNGGADDMRMILAMGIFVVGVFVSIFLFYTNSFIMKRRKKELGVYNILGMEKKHLAKVLFIETLFTAGITTGCGLGFGIIFNKFLSMILYRLAAVDLNVPYYISGSGCMNAIKLFVIIYGVAFCYNMMQIKLANPIELLHSSNAGEREPKTKVFMTLVGIVSLGAGYYIAVTTTTALGAITWFFFAVLLVIVGTYCLFTAGSIAILKLLRKNKKFYYQTKHFTTVSGMIYRMKQNAVGLSNICILSTMVLITVSTTVCMYVGVEDSMKVRYPSEINIQATYIDLPQQQDEIGEMVRDSLKQSGRTITSEKEYLSSYFTAFRRGNEIVIKSATDDSGTSVSEMSVAYLLTKEDYEVQVGKQLDEIGAGEVAIASIKAFDDSTVSLAGEEYNVSETRSVSEDFDVENLTIIVDACYIIVPDRAALEDMLELVRVEQEKEGMMSVITYNWEINIDGNAEEIEAAEKALNQRISDWQAGDDVKEKAFFGILIENRQENKASFYSLYGALLFLGLFLGTLFLMVTVLIIFYKQISEGYEDKERFAIMEKVGMSNVEVKRAIRSQVLMVFFLPLGVAILHVIMAFPMIRRLLACLNLVNTPLFVACVAVSALIFGIIYFIVFIMTSRSYYKIVGNQI